MDWSYLDTRVTSKGPMDFNTSAIYWGNARNGHLLMLRNASISRWFPSLSKNVELIPRVWYTS